MYQCPMIFVSMTLFKKAPIQEDSWDRELTHVIVDALLPLHICGVGGMYVVGQIPTQPRKV